MGSKPHLPVSRINMIMKSCADVEIVSKESSQILTKATEMFIRQLAEDGYGMTNKGKKLDYKHLAEVVNKEERYEFLKDIMPRKITVAKYKKILSKLESESKNGRKSDSSSSGESDSDDDSSDNSE